MKPKITTKTYSSVPVAPPNDGRFKTRQTMGGVEEWKAGLKRYNAHHVVCGGHGWLVEVHKN